jgi:hypothetical protein
MNRMNLHCVRNYWLGFSVGLGSVGCDSRTSEHAHDVDEHLCVKYKHVMRIVCAKCRHSVSMMWACCEYSVAIVCAKINT